MSALPRFSSAAVHWTWCFGGRSHAVPCLDISPLWNLRMDSFSFAVLGAVEPGPLPAAVQQRRQKSIDHGCVVQSAVVAARQFRKRRAGVAQPAEQRYPAARPGFAPSPARQSRRCGRRRRAVCPSRRTPCGESAPRAPPCPAARLRAGSTARSRNAGRRSAARSVAPWSSFEFSRQDGHPGPGRLRLLAAAGERRRRPRRLRGLPGTKSRRQ